MRMHSVQGGVTAPRGFSASSSSCGIKKSGKRDVAILFSEKICTAAAVFTSNSLKAAPVLFCAEQLRRSRGRLQAVVINSGNANALTGEAGISDTRRTAAFASARLGVREEHVAVCSTGIIGRRLPVRKLLGGISRCASTLSSSVKAGSLAADAILTTDRVRKEIAFTQVTGDGRRITVGGMTKGSGMIAPSMQGLHATTLTFITTDAPVSRPYLQKCTERFADETFNMVSIDGDQSTNDTLLVLANGMAGGPEIEEDSAFEEALFAVMDNLSEMIAMDGEGATKYMKVKVEGARNAAEARRVARSIISSSLVKCALFGGDPNVGRVAAAAGNAGVEIDFSKFDLSLNGRSLIRHGRITGRLDMAADEMKSGSVLFRVNLNEGEASAEAKGCDISYGYVRINSAYST